ncbi:colanic acid biosynthesis acetyltransferase WcaF [Mesorhizobium sp. M0701]|uniref:colanic acid biosynthesis acetyltransferase WcaF n=1 Tax=unclassified Mesorhizobium TaxID=325217 RepID=UPI00333AF0C9
MKNEFHLDVAGNRAARKWSGTELVVRLLWDLSHPLFALSPRPLWGWRRSLLRLFGARIGREVHIYPTVRIAIPWNLTIGDQSAIGDRAILYALGPISIAARVTISQGAHLCAGTHDYRDPVMPLEKRPIVIGPGAWVCADAFIGPGVMIGAGAIAGARAVVVKDVDENSIVAGNPAVKVGRR